MKRNRRAFSMITAIIVIVLMATVAGFVFSLSGKMVKSTTIQYQREQAMLLARSYTEYAILAVMSNDRTTNCLQTITGTTVGNTPATGDGYKISVDIKYIGRAAVLPAGCNILSSAVNTTSTPLSIIVDVYVQYKDPDNTAGAWISYHKRTLQKI